MAFGPVELLVVSFPGNQFNGDVAPALGELLSDGLVRLIDLVFVTKDPAGTSLVVELDDLEAEVGQAFSDYVSAVTGLVSDEDIEQLTEAIEPGSSAAILLVEHVWATRFATAVRESGGELVDSVRIPGDVIDEAAAAQAESA